MTDLAEIVVQCPHTVEAAGADRNILVQYFDSIDVYREHKHAKWARRWLEFNTRNKKGTPKIQNL